MSKSPELKSATQRSLYFFDNAKISADPFEKALDIAQGTIKNLKNGKNLISADCIIKFSKYFNVSADYLLCLTDELKPLENCEIQQSESSVPAILREMPDLFKEQRYINTTKIYNELPDEYRERAFGLIMGIAVGLGINVENILRR